MQRTPHWPRLAALCSGAERRFGAEEEEAVGAEGVRCVGGGGRGLWLIPHAKLSVDKREIQCSALANDQ